MLTDLSKGILRQAQALHNRTISDGIKDDMVVGASHLVISQVLGFEANFGEYSPCKVKDPEAVQIRLVCRWGAHSVNA